MSSRQETRDLTLGKNHSMIPTPLAGLSANGFVIQRATKDDFPTRGNEAGVYVDGSTGKVYYWRDGEYHEIIVSTDGYVIDGAVLMLKTKTAAEWEMENPILAKGEVGFISDQNLFKVGDGEKPFNELSILKANENDVPDWAMLDEPAIPIANVVGLTEDLQTKENNIIALQDLVGEDEVSIQIHDAISNLDLPNTYEPLGVVADLEKRTKEELKTTTDPIIAEAKTIREIAESKTTMVEVEKKDYATKAQVAEHIQSLDYEDKNPNGYFVSGVSETDGIVSVTHRAIRADDIPILSQSKITNLAQTLANKQNTIYWQNDNYDGKTNKAITKKDLDDAFSKVASAIQFKGIVEKLPDVAQNGDMYIVGTKEYIYVVDNKGARFEEFGDQAIYAVKGEISNSDIASNAAIAIDKIAGLTEALSAKQEKSELGTMAYEEKAAYPTQKYFTEVIRGLYVRDQGNTKKFVYAIDQTNGLVQPKYRALDITDIPALTIAKTIGLQSSLDAKVETSAFKTEQTEVRSLIDGQQEGLLNIIEEKVASGEFRGDQGDPAFVYFAYANSKDGTIDFTLKPIEGKIYTYLGQYTSNSATQSEQSSTYTWALLSDEPARVAAEDARVVAEESRQDAEDARAKAESERKAAESERVTADAKRQTINDQQVKAVETAATNAASSEKNAKSSETAAASSEKNAKQSEENTKTSEVTVEGYINTIAKEPVAQDILAAAKDISEQVHILVQADSDETIRRGNEEQRIASESARQTAEAQRIDNENARITAESARQTAETNRDSSENARLSAETARISAETNRANAESARVTAESARASAETERVAHEAERQAALDKAVSAASASETNAAKSETNAASSATAAAKSETNASTSETNAKSSETTVAGYVESIAKEVTAADILTAVQTCNELLKQILEKSEV